MVLLDARDEIAAATPLDPIPDEDEEEPVTTGPLLEDDAPMVTDLLTCTFSLLLTLWLLLLLATDLPVEPGVPLPPDDEDLDVE